MKFILSLCILIFSFFSVYSQALSKEYISATREAESFYKKRKYNEAIPIFQAAFIQNKNMASVLHRYELASCFSVLNQPDSAFVQLTRITEKGNFAGYDLISKDINFVNLRKDPRWDSLMEKIKKNAIDSGRF